MTNKEAKERYFKKVYDSASIILCECGCGVSLKSFDKYARPVRFISGHNRRKYSGEDSSKSSASKRYKAKNKDKLRDYKREYYRKKKLKAMELLGNTCTECGVEYNGSNSPIFEFHHFDPQFKEDGITRMLINKAWSKTLEELEKCVLVCANCHNLIHGGEW